MEALLNRLISGQLADPLSAHLLAVVMQHFYAFALVFVRMSGLMTVGPVFGQTLVPANLRILLVLTLTFVITPTIGDQSRIAFIRFDADHDGRLTRDEIPEQLQARFDALLARGGKQATGVLTADEFTYELKVPASIFEFAWTGIGEFALGLVLGLGILTLFSGLQLAGEMIDQQTGIALGEIANPGFEINSSVTGQFLFLFGVTALLLLAPTGGHLLLIGSLVETFQSLPVGSAYVSPSAIGLLRDLVTQSLVLGIQVAAPLLATMALVAVAMGFLGHSVPQINVLVVGFPVRASIGLLLLSVTVSACGELLVDAIPNTIDALRESLAGF